MAGAAVDAYFDASSPFSYLALTQLPALAAAGAAVRLRPILVGGLFRDVGQANVPLLAFLAAEAALRQPRDGALGALVGRAVRDADEVPQRTRS